MKPVQGKDNDAKKVEKDKSTPAPHQADSGKNEVQPVELPDWAKDSVVDPKTGLHISQWRRLHGQ